MYLRLGAVNSHQRFLNLHQQKVIYILLNNKQPTAGDGATWTFRKNLCISSNIECLHVCNSCRIILTSDVSPSSGVPTFNRLHPLRDQTHLDFGPAAKLSTNKGNGTLHNPSLWNVALEGRKKTSPVISQIHVYLKYRQGKMKSFFFQACTPYDSNLGVLCILARACGLW